MSACASRPKPYWTMSAPGCCLRRRTVPIGSWSITVVFVHSGSVSVVETTYLVIALMWSLNGSPERLVHTGTNPS